MMLLLSVDVAAMWLRLLLLLVGRMFVIILGSSAGSFSVPSLGCVPCVLLAKMSQFVNQSVCQSLVYNGQALLSLLLLRRVRFVHSWARFRISLLGAVATVCGSTGRMSDKTKKKKPNNPGDWELGAGGWGQRRAEPSPKLY